MTCQVFIELQVAPGALLDQHFHIARIIRSTVITLLFLLLGKLKHVRQTGLVIGHWIL